MDKLNMDFMSSLFCSLAIRTIVAPLYRIKVLLQSQQNLLKTGKIIDPYTSSWNCYSRISSEGFKSLYRGNVPNLCAQVVTSCFICQDPKKQWLTVGIPGSVGPLNLFLGVMLRYPFEFASTRLAADVINPKGKREFRGTYDVLHKTYTQDGIRGIYRGCTTSFWGHATLYLSMFLFENLREFVSRGGSALILFPLSIIYITGSHFWDTVSTRMKMTTGRPPRDVFKSTFQCIFQIMEKENPKYLVAGLLAACGIGLAFESLGDFWKRETGGVRARPETPFTGPVKGANLERRRSDKYPLEDLEE